MSDSIYIVCTCIHIFLKMLMLSRQDNNMSITMKLMKIGIYPRISIRKSVAEPTKEGGMVNTCGCLTSKKWFKIAMSQLTLSFLVWAGAFKAEPHVGSLLLPFSMKSSATWTTLGLPENRILMVENITFIEMCIWVYPQFSDKAIYICW